MENFKEKEPIFVSCLHRAHKTGWIRLHLLHPAQMRKAVVVLSHEGGRRDFFLNNLFFFGGWSVGGHKSPVGIPELPGGEEEENPDQYWGPW